MTASRFQRRPAEVEAMQVTAETADQVAAWADGRVDRDKQTSKLLIRLPGTRTPGTVGDWIVRDVMPDGLSPARVMLANVMEWAYQPIPGVGLRHRKRH